MATRRRRGGARRWQRWTENQARAVLEELAASSESAAAFARRNGISSQRLAYWKKRVVTEPAFVPVTLPVGACSAIIEIHVPGVVVRVREDLDVDHVARLVEALGRRGGAC